ncbi:MAG: hypothetical protein NXH75_05655, partial [Halobacteriovoraceae bacterium]|nr:hypothetical protein [Halobacteriovoraceae bacterium]
EIPSGGTRVHPKELINTNDEGFLFNMDGKNIYKKASEVFPPFYKKVLKKHEYKNEDFSLFVPHQASLLALKLMCKKLNIAEEKFVINLEKYGNLVGASIPMSLHESLVSDKIKPGDKVLLLATAAGLTLGLSGIQF